MALRDIIILPDKRLRSVSKPVVAIGDEIRTLVADMFETMYEAPGIGLAAIQVGVPSRVIVMDLSKREAEAEPRVFINPEITWSSEEQSLYEEGCLSIPDVHEDVERPARVKIRYLDLEGKPHEEDSEGRVGGGRITPRFSAAVHARCACARSVSASPPTDRCAAAHSAKTPGCCRRRR